MTENNEERNNIEVIDSKDEPKDRHLALGDHITVKGLIAFLLGMGSIWFVGTLLTPLLPEEIIIMLIYAILYFFFGFDISKIAGGIFKKKL